MKQKKPFKFFNDQQNKETDSELIKASKDFVIELCESFAIQANQYNPEKSFCIIDNYVNKGDHLSRILYSEISQNIFQCNTNEVGLILTNIDKLVNFSLRDENRKFNQPVVDIVLRVYDHVHLADIQTSAIKDIAKEQNVALQKDLDDFKKKLHKTNANYERKVEKAQQNYVTVLGLFIAILVATGGVFVQSSSLFNNIVKVSIESSEKLILAASIVSAIIGNLIFFMACFIAKISGIEEKIYEKWWKRFTFSMGIGIIFSYGVYLVIPVVRFLFNWIFSGH